MIIATRNLSENIATNFNLFVRTVSALSDNRHSSATSSFHGKTDGGAENYQI